MSNAAAQQPVAATNKASPQQASLLQRKCACGAGKSPLAEQCEECQTSVLQTKLVVGSSDDPLEGEADRIANQVMAMPRRSDVSGAPVRVQHFTGNESGQTMEVPPSVERVLASPGQPLEPGLREGMEGRFGYDFSTVRVHTGEAAEQSAFDVNAHAFTVGNHLVFKASQYSPDSDTGRRLIAHELVHVLQQSDGASCTSLNMDLKPVSENHLSVTRIPPLHSTIALQRQVADSAPRHSRRRSTAPSARRTPRSFERLSRSHREIARQVQQISSALDSLVRSYMSAYWQRGVSRQGEAARFFVNAVATWRAYELEIITEDSIDAEHLSEWLDRVRNVLTSLEPLLPLLNDRNAAETLEFQRGTLQRRTHRLSDTAFIDAGREERERRHTRAAGSGSAVTTDHDTNREATEALRRYVRRNLASMRAHASLHVGNILDILRRQVGRDRTAINSFLEGLRVSEPELINAISLGEELARALSERSFIDEAVAALQSYVEQHRAEIESNPDNHVTPIREILAAHLGLSATVIREFLDGLHTSNPELYAAVSLGGRTLADVIAHDRSVLPSVGRALVHGLMGEWHPETDTTGMTDAEREEAESEDLASIGISTLISLIPGFDQVSDARDLTAHAYFMISREGEASSPMRWVGLVFSLIGALPTVGSAIKGLSQVLMRGVGRHGYRTVARIYNLIERVLPGALDTLIAMRRGLVAGWDALVVQGQRLWNSFLTRGRAVLEQLIGLTAERLRQIEEFTSRMMPEAFTQARALFEEAFDAIISTARRVGSGISEGIPQFLTSVRERFMSLSATGRLRLEVERFEALERASREAFERGDIASAERLARELDDLVNGAEHLADDIDAPTSRPFTNSEPGEPPTRRTTEDMADERFAGESPARASERTTEARTTAGVVDEFGNVSRATRDGEHRLIVTRNGRLVRCSQCQELAQRYRLILEGNPDMRFEGEPSLRSRLEELQTRAQAAADSGDEARRLEINDELVVLEDDLRRAEDLFRQHTGFTDEEFDEAFVRRTRPRITGGPRSGYRVDGRRIPYYAHRDRAWVEQARLAGMTDEDIRAAPWWEHMDAERSRPPRRRMDVEDFRLEGESYRAAVLGVQQLIGQRISDTPLVGPWNSARERVLNGRSIDSITRDEMLGHGQFENRGLYARAQREFWSLVRSDGAAVEWLDDLGFELREGSEGAAHMVLNETGRAPDAAGRLLGDIDTRVTLDHVLEKSRGENWRLALDGENLRFEFHDANSEREAIQARLPELRQ